MRTTLATTNARIDDLDAKLDAILARLDGGMPAKTATPAPAPEAAPAPASKILTREAARKIKATKAGKKYAGMTRAEMLEAGLKGYALPSGTVRAAIKAAKAA